jgi:CDGSH-type Zn-finger protein
VTRDQIATVRLSEDGPLLIRGPILLLDESGAEVPVRRRVNALCRCGRSAIQPFCDGTHKVVPFSPRSANGVSAEAGEAGSRLGR